jgi:NADPH:quinone reductase-like Zn-dependent oxidoreductase
MKAAVIYEFGGPEVIKYVNYPNPVVAAGEVLARVAAASINPVDTFERAGKDWGPLQFPVVLGWDVAGSVLALGPGVTGFSVGDRVLAWADHTYAELCAVKPSCLRRSPKGSTLLPPHLPRTTPTSLARTRFPQAPARSGERSADVVHVPLEHRQRAIVAHRIHDLG